MARKRNRYQNSLGVSALLRWVLVVGILGITGTSYVYIKNQHVAKSDRKKALEEEIKMVEREIEAIELRYASMMDRVAVRRKLDLMGSSLRKIDSEIVQNIVITDQPREYAVDTQGDR